jgi:IS5 family transposase
MTTKLGEALLAQVGQELQARGFKVNNGTIVDATILGWTRGLAVD